MTDDENGDIERLLRRARDDPGAVPIDPIVDALDGTTGADRGRALGALYAVSKSDPDRIVDAVPDLAAVLGHDRVTHRAKAVMTLRNVGAVRPEAVAPHADALSRALEDESGTVRRGAADSLGQIGAENPTAVESAVPTLIEMVESGSDPSRRRAIDALRSIVADESTEIEIPVEPLLDILEDRHEPPSDLGYDPKRGTERATVNDQLRGLRTLANDDSERSENVRMREGAVEILAIRAANDPATVTDALGSHRDRVAALLDDRNPTIRGAIVGVLAYVAEIDPDLVRPSEERLIELLDEPIAISGNAVWALRFLESERAIDALRGIVEDERGDSELRTITQRALDSAEEVT